MSPRVILPLESSFIRDLFAIEDLVALTAPKLSPDLIMRKALSKGHAFLAQDKSAKSLNAIVLTPRGELALIKITRSTWTGIWNFSTGKKLVKVT